MDAAEAELLAAIERDPDDDDARRVYADWLEERGDPRGEYLRLEMLLRGGPARFRELADALDEPWLRAVTRHYRVVLVGVGSQMIMTIKVVRELTGMGLRDAKILVDGVRAGKPGVVREAVPPLDAEELVRKFPADSELRLEPTYADRIRLAPKRCAAVLVGVVGERRIDAIKAVREITGLGLAKARALVDTAADGTPAALALGVTNEEAERIVARFAGLGEVRVEL